MSEVQLILIKSNKIVCIKDHYRAVKEILSNLEAVNNLSSQELDAGYILVDFDRRLVLNCQEAFSANEIEQLREFDCLLL